MFIITKDELRPEVNTKMLNDKINEHLLLVATSDVYFQNARMLNGQHEILDLNTYNAYYKNFLNDIELVTEPIDAFVPPMMTEEAETENNEKPKRLFLVNHVGPEWEKINNRVTFEDMKNTLPPTSEIVMRVTDDPSLFPIIKDDIYIYWSLNKYLQQLDWLRIEDLSRQTPVIEYVVRNIRLPQIKQHLHSKINISKYVQYIRELFFPQDYQFTRTFYLEPHGDIPAIDVEVLMQKLISNIDIQTDQAIIVGIYLTLSFAIADIRGNKESECVDYVREVLSKI